MANPARQRAPWHLWAVGIATLLWNAIGAADYTLTEALGVPYLAAAGMDGEGIAWVARMAPWAVATWALGTWGGVLGSILLLARSRWAVTGSVVSLIGIVPLMFYQYLSAMPASMSGSGAVAMSVAIVLLALAQLWYALKLRGAGVLR